MENILIKIKENLRQFMNGNPRRNWLRMPERSEFWVSSRAQENHPLYQKQRQNPKQKRKEALVMWQSEPTYSAGIQDSTCCRRLTNCLMTICNLFKSCNCHQIGTPSFSCAFAHVHTLLCFALTMDIEWQSQSKSPRQYGDMLLWKFKKSGTFVGPHSQS